MKVFLAHSEEDASSAWHVASYLRDNDLEIALPDVKGVEATRQVLSSVLSADVCIALIGSHPGRELFDIGVAMGAGVPTLVVALAGATVPVTLSSNLYVAFRGDWAWDLHNLGLRLLEVERSSRPERSIEGIDEESAQAVERDLELADALNEKDFVRLVGMLLKRRGFHLEADETRTSPWADLVCRTADDELVVFEVKKRGRNGLVPVEAVRQTFGFKQALNAGGAVVVSDGGFTSSAHAFAEEVGVNLLSLDDLVATSNSREVLHGFRNVRRSRASGLSRVGRSAGVPPQLAGRMGVFDGDSVALARLFLRLQWELAKVLPSADLGAAEVQTLLNAYIRTKDEGAVSVSDFVVSSGLPATAGLRLMSRLVATGLLQRYPDPKDRRRQLVSMPEACAAKMGEVLSAFAREPEGADLSLNP